MKKTYGNLLFIKKDMIGKRYNVILSSHRNKKHKVEKINSDTLKIYISDEVDSLGFLLFENKAIKSLKFENFYTKGINTLENTFNGLELENTLNLGGINLKGIETLNGTFNNVKVNGNIIIEGDLPKLKELSNVFLNTECKDIIINIKAEQLEEIKKIGYAVKCDNIKIKTSEYSKPKIMNDLFYNTIISNILDLSNIDFTYVENLDRLLKDLICKEVTLGLTSPDNINEVSHKDIIEDINEDMIIKCNKEMARLFYIDKEKRSI